MKKFIISFVFVCALYLTIMPISRPRYYLAGIIMVTYGIAIEEISKRGRK